MLTGVKAGSCCPAPSISCLSTGVGSVGERQWTARTLSRTSAGDETARVRPSPILTCDGQGSGTKEPRASHDEEEKRRDVVGRSRVYVDGIRMSAMLERSDDFIREPGPRRFKLSL